jgi:hypothetical protein
VPSVTATASGSGDLATVSIQANLLGGAPVRGFRIDGLVGSSIKSSTGYRQGLNCLIPFAGSPTTVRGAARDEFGVWTEWSTATALTVPGTFTPGSIEGSVGSGAVSDILIQSPGIEFPDLSAGSGRMQIRKTYLSKSTTWLDEVRNPQWTRGRAAFHVKFEDLDIGQAELIHRLWRATNGPQIPFFFDYVDPSLGTRLTAGATRYLVRFRDASLTSKIFDVTLSSFEFFLVEVMEDPEGGDL